MLTAWLVFAQGMDWSRVGRQALIGAVIGAVVGAVVWGLKKLGSK